MPKAPHEMNPIDFLVRRKFRMSFAPPPFGSSASDTLAHKSLMKEVEDYRRKLFALPANELQEMHYVELSAFQKEQEAELFYNKPFAQADYRHWSRAPYWTLDEAISLTFGKDPRIVAPDKFLEFSHQDGFVKKYLELNDIVNRARKMKLLTDPIQPSVYIIWAKQSGYEIPADLESAIVNNAAHTTDWKLEHDKLKEVMAEKLRLTEARLHDIETEAANATQCKDTRIEQLKAQLEEATAKPLGTRERETLLKILIGMAVGGYGHDTKSSRSSTVSEITSDLEKVGLSVSDDTVRKWLNEAAGQLPSEALQNQDL